MSGSHRSHVRARVKGIKNKAHTPSMSHDLELLPVSFARQQSVKVNKHTPIIQD